MHRTYGKKLWSWLNLTYVQDEEGKICRSVSPSFPLIFNGIVTFLCQSTSEGVGPSIRPYSAPHPRKQERFQDVVGKSLSPHMIFLLRNLLATRAFPDFYSTPSIRLLTRNRVLWTHSEALNARSLSTRKETQRSPVFVAEISWCCAYPMDDSKRWDRDGSLCDRDVG